MPTAIDNGPAERQRRTLAQKLQWLRDIKTPRGEQPPSYEATARRITELTGVSISGPYYWELVTGRTTNPKLHHIQALARFYTVPVGYLADEGGDFRQLESELELLHALKRGGVTGITLQGADGPNADLPTIEGLLGQLRLLERFGDEESREDVLRLSTLTPEQRAVLQTVAGDAGLLEALSHEGVRELARAAAGLGPERLGTAADVVRRPDVLDALLAAEVRDALGSLAALSAASRQAVVSLIRHLHDLEERDAPA
jgi:transcriptional regulator with XRE-family HTH domain